MVQDAPGALNGGTAGAVNGKNGDAEVKDDAASDNSDGDEDDDEDDEEEDDEDDNDVDNEGQSRPGTLVSS